ncbi:hypothetical protein L1987_81181 [Smallanthus sonchifolius]|uniref:Uncharacterized protein n=1 Tax=Smallanthus sonchifolius TaxID=185202 RepID=A0ACB8YQ67_9ASTR|nr:hypothetical protein L1987_81181 [Smallanthus sonchifolius]
MVAQRRHKPTTTTCLQPYESICLERERERMGLGFQVVWPELEKDERWLAVCSDLERERDDDQLRLWRRDSIGTMARNDFPRSETDGWRFGFGRDDNSDLAATTTEAATMVAMITMVSRGLH